jgi:hypothetical protein
MHHPDDVLTPQNHLDLAAPLLRCGGEDQINACLAPDLATKIVAVPECGDGSGNGNPVTGHGDQVGSPAHSLRKVDGGDPRIDDGPENLL